MENGLVKCCICEGVATTTCDYCDRPVCRNTESCYKLIEGLDPGRACVACFAVIMSSGLIDRFEGIGPVGPPS